MALRQWLDIPDTKYGAEDILRWLWRAWRGNRLQTACNAAVALLTVVVSLTQVWAVKHAIDVASGDSGGNIYLAVAFIGGLILADFALNMAGIWIRNLLGIKAQNRMQQRILDRIMQSEWHGKETRHSGDVLNRLEFDVVSVVNFLTETLPSSFSVLAMFIGAFMYMASMDWRLALLVTFMIPVFVLVSKVYMKRMRGLTRQVRDSDSKVQAFMQEIMQNRMLLKTLESNDFMIGRLEETQSELRRNVVRRTSFSVFSSFVLNLGFALGYLVAFLWAAVRMAADTLTFGGMTAFLQLVNRIQGSARSLTKLVPAFVSVFTAAERLMELEEDPLEEQGETVMLDPPCGIRVDNVSYKYSDGESNVIENLSFDFSPGSCTAILGETGAGKTTLVRMLLALLRPQSGNIYIYNDVENHMLSPLTRANFIYVPQGNTLMSGTVRENLRLGKFDASEEEMREALHKSCAEFVFELPDGMDTVCTEQGGGLSEGQAQRVSIARALLRNRPVMLFDEATSALDPVTERRLLRNILAGKDKTVIFITHRLAVMDYCDSTLEIRCGKN